MVSKIQLKSVTLIRLENRRRYNIDIKDIKCVECSSPADELHHIVPFVNGGKWAIPLCCDCHRKAHGDKPLTQKRSDLIKEGIKKAKIKGKQIGRKRTGEENLIIEYRKAGKTYREISKLLNIGQGTITRSIKRNSYD